MLQIALEMVWVLNAILGVFRPINHFIHFGHLAMQVSAMFFLWKYFCSMLTVVSRVYLCQKLMDISGLEGGIQLLTQLFPANNYYTAIFQNSLCQKLMGISGLEGGFKLLAQVILENYSKI